MVKGSFDELLADILSNNNEVQTTVDLIEYCTENVALSDWIYEIIKEFRELDQMTQSNIGYILGNKEFKNRGFFDLYIIGIFEKRHKIIKGGE